MRQPTWQSAGHAPCDRELHGKTADEVINGQDQHLKDAVKGGDTAHEAANEKMRGRWKHPQKSLGWYMDTKEAFDALPED